MPKKVYFTLAALIFLPTVIFINLVSGVSAVSLTKLSDTLTRLQKGELSSHTIRFSLPDSESFDAGETIEYDFGEDDGRWDVDSAKSSVSDFDFNDGTKRNLEKIKDDCTGFDGPTSIVVGIDNTTGVVIISACKNYISSAFGATITFKFGSITGGDDRVKNPIKSGSTILKITHTTSNNQSIFSQLAVPIMDFDGVGITSAEITSNPGILGSQIGQIKNEESYLDSPIINQGSKETSTSSKDNLVVEDCFFANFTATIPNF